MNECLTTPQHKNKSAIGRQTNGIKRKKSNVYKVKIHQVMQNVLETNELKFIKHLLNSSNGYSCARSTVHFLWSTGSDKETPLSPFYYNVLTLPAIKTNYD